MSKNDEPNKDIVDLLEEGSKEPVDEADDSGFVALDEDGKPVNLDKKPEKTKNSAGAET